MYTEIKIEKGVSYPHKRRAGKRVFPFDKMDVGDSFFIPLGANQKIKSLQCQLSNNAKSYCLRNRLLLRFKTSIEDGGVRIWRAE
jgi:hypothetical protein